MNLFKKMSAWSLILFILFLVLFMPFSAIWSINNLFGLGIEFTFKTWLSVVILNLYFFVGNKK